MTKTEAAEIIVTQAHVIARRYGWIGPMTATRIGIVLSEMEHQSEPGSRIQQAAQLRPSDQTIRSAGRRAR